ncbi:type II toxin-antitoxin system RelE/ParE family toxin [uncultured Maricaulis sp.]|uniref:type II toxin-antitoxin system RelE/ParE family toxin n=1 Tax=uncultured Maricaulis sp. TaxID=174710 RepID=UPI0034594C40
MSDRWRLTPQARRAIQDIARWTVQTFGPEQADRYRQALIDTCSRVAGHQTFDQSCRRLVAHDLAEDLRFARCEQHFIVFVRDPGVVTIIDILHARSDLPGKLSRLDRAP